MLPQCSAFEDCVLAEFFADFVCGLFRSRALSGLRVQQVWRHVCRLCVHKVRDAATDQPVGAFVAHLIEQGPRRAVNCVRHVAGPVQGKPARERTVVGPFQFERHHFASYAFGFGPI